MDFGISSSCFYPLETEKAVEQIGLLGIKNAEIFFNSPMEMNGEIFEKITDTIKRYSMNILSVHPCTSGCESFFLFSSYERRFIDMLDFYRKYFEVCNKLGAKYLIIHGMKKDHPVEPEKYFERYAKLFEEGKKAGVTVAQENVFNYVCSDVDYLLKMKNYLKENFKLVFDLKQMRKCGYVEDDFLSEFIEDIVHIHISDSKDRLFCLPPGEGDYDFSSFLKKMDNARYSGSCIIELYRENYENYTQLRSSYDYLSALYKASVN